MNTESGDRGNMVECQVVDGSTFSAIVLRQPNGVDSILEGLNLSLR